MARLVRTYARKVRSEARWSLATLPVFSNVSDGERRFNARRLFLGPLTLLGVRLAGVGVLTGDVCESVVESLECSPPEPDWPWYPGTGDEGGARPVGFSMLGFWESRPSLGQRVDAMLGKRLRVRCDEEEYCCFRKSGEASVSKSEWSLTSSPGVGPWWRVLASW